MITLIKKPLIWLFLCLVSFPGLSQWSDPANNDFQDIRSYGLNGYTVGNHFNKGSVEFWQSYKGDAKIKEDNGNKYASMRFGARSSGNTNFVRIGDAIALNFPFIQGKQYKITFKHRVSTPLSGSQRLNRLFIIGDKCLDRVVNQAKNGLYGADIIPDFQDIGSDDREIIKDYDISINNNINNTSWASKTIYYTPNGTIDQVLFLPYKYVNLFGQVNSYAELHIDDVVITRTATNPVPLTRPAAAKVNNMGSNFCEGDEISVNTNGTVNNWGHFQYYTGIAYRDQNGTLVNYHDHRWTWGNPACEDINLQDYYNQPFTANTDGSPRTYYFKFAINGNHNNQWHEQVRTFRVHRKPDFGFNLISVPEAGESVTRSVTNLSGSGNYSFEWYNGQWPNNNIIGTSNHISVGSFFPGTVYNTVKVINNDHPACSTTKTVATNFISFKRINPNATPSIDSQKEKAAVVYPNPGTGDFNVRLEGIESNGFEGKLSLVNLSGQVVYSANITELNPKVTLDKYTPGIYMLIVEGKDFKMVEKVILK